MNRNHVLSQIREFDFQPARRAATFALDVVRLVRVERVFIFFQMFVGYALAHGRLELPDALFLMAT